jgi:uncharacterized protein (DUF983 family)
MVLHFVGKKPQADLPTHISVLSIGDVIVVLLIMVDFWAFYSVTLGVPQ